MARGTPTGVSFLHIDEPHRKPHNVKQMNQPDPQPASETEIAAFVKGAADRYRELGVPTKQADQLLAEHLGRLSDYLPACK